MGLFSRKPEAEGVPGRAVITYYGYGHDLGEEPPDGSGKHRVKFDVRVIEPEPRQDANSIKTWLTGEVMWLLKEGVEIPVLVDSDTGAAVDVDQDRLVEELAERGPEFEAARKHAASLGYELELFRDDTK